MHKMSTDLKNTYKYVKTVVMCVGITDRCISTDENMSVLAVSVCGGAGWIYVSNQGH